jgi:hypothetical protein
MVGTGSALKISAGVDDILRVEWYPRCAIQEDVVGRCKREKLSARKAGQRLFRRNEGCGNLTRLSWRRMLAINSTKGVKRSEQKYNDYHHPSWPRDEEDGEFEDCSDEKAVKWKFRKLLKGTEFSRIALRAHTLPHLALVQLISAGAWCCFSNGLSRLLSLSNITLIDSKAAVQRTLDSS